jgi:hypothetical protein
MSKSDAQVGIQQLMQAEQEAQNIVAKARQGLQTFCPTTPNNSIAAMMIYLSFHEAINVWFLLCILSG